MATLHETEIDGVRCFWVETGRPTLTAALMFRFGVVDEPMPESGWQHLLEHLALNDRAQGTLEVNGHVGLLDTQFVAHGPPTSVAQHLDSLTLWLNDPQIDDLGHEVAVLRAESATRVSGFVRHAIVERYGAQGPGLVGFDELATSRAQPELLRERARVAFARGNGVLALDGPPPAGLRLTLPEGPGIPIPSAVPLAQATPALYRVPTGFVLSGLVPRSDHAPILTRILESALSERFRQTEGVAYAPTVAHEPVDADQTLVLARSDLLPAAHASVTDSIQDLLAELVTHGPGEARLSEAKAAKIQELKDPFRAIGVALRAAGDALENREVMTLEEYVAAVEAVDGETLQNMFAAMQRSALLGVPLDAPDNGIWTRLAIETEHRERSALATRFRHRNWPKATAELVIDPLRAELRAGGDALAFEFTQVVGMTATRDGHRVLIHRDGRSLTIDPDEWQRGMTAIALVDERVPTSLWLPQPDRTGPRFQGLSFSERWLGGVQGLGSSIIWLAIAFFGGFYLTLGSGRTLKETVLLMALVVGVSAASLVVQIRRFRVLRR